MSSEERPKGLTVAKVMGIIAGVLALEAGGYFIYKAFYNDSKSEASVELDSIPETAAAIEIEETSRPVNLADGKGSGDETFHFEGPYSIFGLTGRARYSYKIDEACNTLLDGSFEFDEGIYEDDGTFNGMGSGVAHISGQFRNNMQIGNWSIGSSHYGIDIMFKDGIPDGKFVWSFHGGYGSGECKGTYRNGKLVGDFSYRSLEGDDDTYLKGSFNSRGKPTGIWEEKRSGGDKRWYIMDQATAKETGLQGSFDGDYMYRENLDLTDRILDISEYVLSNKVTKQNLMYPTYWED